MTGPVIDQREFAGDPLTKSCPGKFREYEDKWAEHCFRRLPGFLPGKGHRKQRVN